MCHTIQEISNRTHWTDPETWVSNNSSNLLRGPLVRSHSIFDGYYQRIIGTYFWTLHLEEFDSVISVFWNLNVKSFEVSWFLACSCYYWFYHPSSSSSLYIWNQVSSYLIYWQLGAWFQIYNNIGNWKMRAWLNKKNTTQKKDFREKPVAGRLRSFTGRTFSSTGIADQHTLHLLHRWMLLASQASRQDKEKLWEVVGSHWDEGNWKRTWWISSLIKGLWTTMIPL